MRLRLALLAALVPFAAGCRTTAPARAPLASPTATAAAASPRLARVNAALDALRADVAPDRRTARFDVTASEEAGRVVLAGETDQPAARRALHERLRADGVAFEDRVRMLPDTAALGERRWGVVSVSVANLRSAPGHAAELATQALLGTPLRLLKKEGGWVLVQTPDRYLAWADEGGFVRRTEAEVRALAAAPQLVYLRASGTAYTAPDAASAPASDLVAGALVELRGEAGGYHRVGFPDGREAFVAKGEAEPYAAWLAGLRTTDETLVAAARNLMGLPYLWGGTSSKGMDCSGFTKTVYLLNGLVLPRDASQQALAGTTVDERGEWNTLRPGDLLFFGRPATDSTAERVIHVGMWVGGGEFIHASGRVRVSSMDPAAANYEPSERRRYLRTRRILGGEQGVALLREGGLYALLERPE